MKILLHDFYAQGKKTMQPKKILKINQSKMDKKKVRFIHVGKYRKVKLDNGSCSNRRVLIYLVLFKLLPQLLIIVKGLGYETRSIRAKTWFGCRIIVSCLGRRK
jgi:hypothetical protein